MAKKYKLKTNKSVRKRFKITAKGKVKMNRSGRRHMATDKPNAKKRRMRKAIMAFKGEERKIKRLLPYG